MNTEITKLKNLIKRSNEMNKIKRQSMKDIYESINNIDILVAQIESEMLDLRCALLNLDE